MSRKLLRAKTRKEHDALAKKYGLYYSVLLDLSYFDCIRFTVIDPMHNLFLGTAKSMFKLWMKLGLLISKTSKQWRKGSNNLMLEQGLEDCHTKYQQIMAVTLHPSGRIGRSFILCLCWMDYYLKSICDAGRHLCWLASFLRDL